MDPVSTAQQLIAFESVTSVSNAAVSSYLAQLLDQLGFQVESLPYTDGRATDKVCVTAKFTPGNDASSTSPGIGFFCHTDVVSVDGWNCPQGAPFSGAVSDGRLWGRGACDMKGPIAAALSAYSQLDLSSLTRPLYFFATGDEECGMSGARLLADKSKHFAEMVKSQSVGIIGEPTSLQVVNSHKGGCHVDVSSFGVAAHSSTSEARNANWQMIPFLSFLRELVQRTESEQRFRNEAFTPPTVTLNLVIENKPNAANITVGQTTCQIFLRPMPAVDWQHILDEIVRVAMEMELTVRAWPPLLPLDTPADSSFVQTALRILEQTSPRAVSYATDGCCFHALSQLIVIGPGNIEQAHRCDEWIELEQLHRGVDIYRRLFEHYAMA